MRAREAGFSLLEALAALACMGAIVSGLSLITGQWLPSWRHGFADLQRVALIGQGLDRTAADFAAAQFVKRDGRSAGPLFEGAPGGATFVRDALGPNAGPGLEIVRYAQGREAGDLVMTRTRATFRPGEADPAFGAPVVVARAPFQLVFAYAGEDGVWDPSWASDRLPSAVRITVRDAGSGATLAASTASLVRVEAAAPSGAGAKPEGEN